MYFRFLFCLIFWVLLPIAGAGQIQSSARLLGMGESGVAVGAHTGALLSNPAGIAWLPGPSVLLGHRYLFHQPDVTVQTLQLTFPIHKHHVGLYVAHFGLQDLYRDLRLGFVYARQFGPDLAFSLGIQHQQLWIPAYINQQQIYLDAGVRYRWSEQFSMGLIFGQLRLSGNPASGHSSQPYLISAGGYYLLGEQVGLALDVVYSGPAQTFWKGGLEYFMVPEQFALRLGFSGQVLQPSAGFGLSWQGFRFDEGTVFHPRLGMSPQFDLAYVFK